MADNFVVPSCAKHADRTDMEVFDSLPSAARKALRESLEDWCVQCVIEGLKNPAYCAVRLRNMDREELWERRFDRMRAAGPYRGCAPVKLDDLLEVDRQWNFPRPGRKRSG